MLDIEAIEAILRLSDSIAEKSAKNDKAAAEKEKKEMEKLLKGKPLETFLLPTSENTTHENIRELSERKTQIEEALDGDVVEEKEEYTKNEYGEVVPIKRESRVSPWANNPELNSRIAVRVEVHAQPHSPQEDQLQQEEHTFIGVGETEMIQVRSSTVQELLQENNQTSIKLRRSQAQQIINREPRIHYPPITEVQEEQEEEPSQRFMITNSIPDLVEFLARVSRPEFVTNTTNGTVHTIQQTPHNPEQANQIQGTSHFIPLERGMHLDLSGQEINSSHRGEQEINNNPNTTSWGIYNDERQKIVVQKIRRR